MSSSFDIFPSVVTSDGRAIVGRTGSSVMIIDASLGRFDWSSMFRAACGVIKFVDGRTCCVLRFCMSENFVRMHSVFDGLSVCSFGTGKPHFSHVFVLSAMSS